MTPAVIALRYSDPARPGTVVAAAVIPLPPLRNQPEEKPAPESAGCANAFCLQHALVGADQVERRLAEDGALAIRHGSPQRHVAPDAAAGRVVRRPDHVR